MLQGINKVFFCLNNYYFKDYCLLVRSYEEYNQSRRLTFLGAKLSATRLTEWLRQHCPECTPKLKLFSIDLLLYLAKETVAQLIDIALLLRQDANMVPTDPFSRLPQPCLPFETFGASNRQVCFSLKFLGTVHVCRKL